MDPEGIDEPELQYRLDVGLDRHVWVSEWESLQDDLHDQPAETLPAIADLVGRMLQAEGFPLDDPVAAGGAEPEMVVEYREARRIADLTAGGGDVDPGDVGSAIEDLRSIYERLAEDARGETL